ncbi:MAG: putative Ig domain-containing protein, partial [Massiliimalia sp.]
MLFFCVCKALLPVTALAAGNDRPYSLYVGNTDVAKTEYSDNAAYWTSSDGGTNWTSQLDKPTADSYIHYDGNGTLTLHNVNISSSNENGIYAEAMSGSAVSLSIVLEGKNNVSGASGIYVFSKLGDASLSISGTGSLTAEGTGGGSFSGIQVQSNNGKAELTINNVDVTATNNVAQGIILRSAGSSTASLTVNGGKLTASGSDAGIKYVFGSSATGDGTPTVTVSGNAIVRANGGISDDSSTDIQIGADSNESNGGIVWNGKDGTVYGDVTLQEDLEIGEGESLTLDDNASLNAGNHNVIVDGGTLDENLANSLGDSVKYAPNIVTTSLSNGTVGTAYSQTLTATGDTPITWSVTGGSLPAGLSLDENTGVISGIPNAAGTYNFTVTATNDAGRDSREYTLKINAVPVTSVTLDKSKLSLYIGNTETLNVTVKPNNATNKNVTWSSSNEKVAVVDESGKVTAKAPGTAVITVKTVDGSKTATCEVTVVRKNSGIIIPPTTNGNWRQTPIGWWYQNPDGTYPANQWRYLDSGKGYKAWYWFNQYGYMTTGWQKVGNTWYYMNRSGEMQTGWVFVNS